MPSTDKPYDLEERTYRFALSVRTLMKRHQWHPVNWSDVQQLLRSSGSVAANFIEFNEAISPGDALYRIRLCRKEAKESRLWLRLIAESSDPSQGNDPEFATLIVETMELVRIFASIIRRREDLPTSSTTGQSTE
jgi:four helix bundle protein